MERIGEGDIVRNRKETKPRIGRLKQRKTLTGTQDKESKEKRGRKEKKEKRYKTKSKK